MTREELHRACFGRGGFAAGDPTLELRAGAAVVASIDLYWRQIVVGEQELEVAALGQVCTDPSYRRQGYASALVRAAHELARRRGVRWAAIFAGSKGVYSSLGYVHPPQAPRYFLVAPTALPALSWPLGAVETRGEW